jgi:hypothetical protein
MVWRYYSGLIVCDPCSQDGVYVVHTAQMTQTVVDNMQIVQHDDKLPN